jgi:diphosphomevalonate decarboxylase
LEREKSGLIKSRRNIHFPTNDLLNQIMNAHFTSFWRCPSNIAIVKYWGKKDDQIPCNASLSLTLSESYTELRACLYNKNEKEDVELVYYFEGERNTSFEQRVLKYLVKHKDHFPFLSKYRLVLESSNSFPHSTGIASSASAFGALALVLADLYEQTEGKPLSEHWLETASCFARLGSGSACRSLFANWVQWGKATNDSVGSDLHAIPITEVHEVFHNMHDAILVVDDEPKKVSSTSGHALMNGHPYAQERFKQANDRVMQLREILKYGDMEGFVQLTESEALTLHAMMMTSKDYYLLMRPNTIAVIEKIFAFREQKRIPLCFTLDAGPNIHMLYPVRHKLEIENFIREQISVLVKRIIFDRAGKGPKQLTLS